MGLSEYNVSGVPNRHKDFRPVNNNGNEKWMMTYDSIKARLSKGSIFAVIGNRGTGKTQLGTSLIGYTTIEDGRTAMYRKAFDIFLRIREAMSTPGDSERKAVKEFTKPFFLVIDAFEVRGETDFENRLLDHIIDLRYDAVLPTMIISNDTPEKIKAALGTSIIDRMTETGGIVEMKWNSFRTNNK